jgi:hypothetical protein
LSKHKDAASSDDGDRITLISVSTDAAYLTIMLTIPHNITWWKGIEVRDRSGTVRAAAWTSDSPAQHVVVNFQ